MTVPATMSIGIKTSSWRPVFDVLQKTAVAVFCTHNSGCDGRYLVRGGGNHRVHVHLRSAVEHLLQAFEHLWVASLFVVVSLLLGIPQADGGDMRRVSVGKHQFVAKTCLLHHERENFFLKYLGELCQRVGLQTY